jgi:hypothetical protein
MKELKDLLRWEYERNCPCCGNCMFSSERCDCKLICDHTLCEHIIRCPHCKKAEMYSPDTYPDFYNYCPFCGQRLLPPAEEEIK